MFAINQTSRRRCLVAAAAVLLVAAGMAWSPAEARTATPEEVVRTYYAALLDVMRNAKALGYEGRYRTLEPVVKKTFNLPLVARIALSRRFWKTLTKEQKDKYLRAFERLSVATYAARFDIYAGEKFEVLRIEKLRRNDVLVRTRIVKSDGDEVPINYLLRNKNGQWQVIDVFLKGTISEVATRRADFSAIMRDKGYDGLIAAIDAKVRQLAKE